MERARSISKSMMSYLKRAREHKEFLLKETAEFERGKRHLANMMGLDINEMTQNDVDKAIKYLFPSGLFDQRAKPVMKHPDLLFKAQKDAQFDQEGRPYHFLFYTIKPNYHENLSKIRKTISELDKFEDEQLAKGVMQPSNDTVYHLSGRNWLTHDQMQDKFLEKLSVTDYEYLIRCLEHLTNHPYAMKAKTFIEEHTVELSGQSLNLELPKLLRDEKNGQIYTEMVVSRKKLSIKVKTVLNGTGIVDIDGKDIRFFEAPHMRAAILFPLLLSGMMDKVDIYAGMPTNTGNANMAIAIRLAVSKSIAAYGDDQLCERLRLAGLLTDDPRRKERKKFGQAKARKKFTWKKR